jgi:hypothetical protein
MPIKPDIDSKHIQLVISNDTEFHETLLVAIKNSDVLVQPLSAPDLHITMHALVGTKNRKNSHVRVDSGQLKKYESKASNGRKIRNGKLVEWNRNICPSYECALELRFHSSFASRSEAPLEYDYHPIECNSGVVHINFWFTSSDEKSLKDYWEGSGVTCVMFHEIPKTKEKFALTYNLSDQTENTDKIVHTDDFYELVTENKGSKYTNTNNGKVKMVFGLSSEHKKIIIFQ